MHYFLLQAQDLPEPMRPKRIVNDFTQLFSPQQQQALEQKLRNFNDTSSTQIAIVTVPYPTRLRPSDYAQRLAEKWGVGQKGKDNGVLLLIKPKSRTEKGQVAIAVGYGLEGVIPDAIASRIIRNEIIPEFQQNNYYRGINKATDVLMQLAGGEFTAEQYARKKRKWQCRSDHHSYLDPISPCLCFSEEKKGIPQVAMEVEESLPYFSEVSAVAAAISVLSAEVAEASEVSAEGVSAVAGPVEAGKTINTDNANTGQYHMFTPQSKARRKAWNICLPDIQAFGTMGGFFPEQHSPVGRSGTGLLSVYGKKDPKPPTSNHPFKSFLYTSVRNLAFDRMEKKIPLRHATDLKSSDKAWEEYDTLEEEVLARVKNEIDKASRKAVKSCNVSIYKDYIIKKLQLN